MRRRLAGQMQALGAGMLVLAMTVAAPALSAAQESAADPGAGAEPPAATPPPAAGPTTEPGEPEADKKPGPKQESGDQAEPAQDPGVPPPPAAEPASKPASKKLAVASAASVSVGDNFFSPASVTISVGETVTWKNNGAAPHSATANNGSFDTGVFDPGQSRSETFSSAGTFSYFCTVHGASQSGTVRVASTSGGGGGGGSASSGGSEAAAVASPDAAGSSTSLPATGFAAIGLAAIGFALLGGGVAVRRNDPEAQNARPRLFSIY